MLKKIVFWGASGHAKVLREFVGRVGYQLVAVFDNAAETEAPFPDVPLYHGSEGFNTWRDSHGDADTACLVAIGGARGHDRLELQRFMESSGIEPVVAVHPRAFVAEDAVLSKGCQILANSSVCPEVVMGEACIVNTNASVDHETVLGDGVHVAPGATLAGCVSVGDYSLIGLGAVVLPRVRIGRNVIVGAGAVVTRDVADGRVVYGNPATIRRENF